MRSLALLIELGKVDREVGLFRAYLHVRRFGLRWLFQILGTLLGPALRQQLINNSPPLWVFDLFKLVVLCQLAPKVANKRT